MKEVIKNNEKKKVEEAIESSKDSSILMNLIQESQHSKKITSIKNHEIVLKVLNTKERSKAFELAGYEEEIKSIDLDNALPEEIKEVSDQISDQFERNKLAIISYSMVSVDGKIIDITREQLFNDLATVSDIMTDILYLEYTRMSQEFMKLVADLESFKKKQQTDQKT